MTTTKPPGAKGVLLYVHKKQLNALDRKAKTIDVSRSAYLRALIADDTGVPDDLSGNRWGQGRK